MVSFPISRFLPGRYLTLSARWQPPYSWTNIPLTGRIRQVKELSLAQNRTRADPVADDVVKDIAEYIDMGGGRHFTATQLLQYFLVTPEQQHNYD